MNDRPAPVKNRSGFVLLLLLGLAAASAGWFWGWHWKQVAAGQKFSESERIIFHLQDQIEVLETENTALRAELMRLTEPEEDEGDRDGGGEAGAGPAEKNRAKPAEPALESPERQR